MGRGFVITSGLILTLLAATSRGADVSFSVSPRETFVGSPVQVQITIQNADQHDPPVFPEIADADVRDQGRSDQSYTSITAAGRTVRRTVIYTYAVFPKKPGTLTIPSVSVMADGEKFATPPTDVRVKKSETGDLMFLKIIGNRESVYVGEPVDVTLQIWLKVFKAPRVRMDENDMWKTVDQRNSNWGPFAENLQQRPVGVQVRTEIRSDDRGERVRYFVYSLNRKIWPERAGSFTANGVRVLVKYPLKVRRNRFSLLGPAYETSESRPISAVVEDSTIAVKSPPSEGRPKSFRGAVGDYVIMVTAAPLEVSVGDPITLNLTIRGGGRLDLMQAPLLGRQESLIADFRVPDEELAGVVKKSEKQFSQSIRAKHDGVTEIPPIEFSYFDPDAEEYVLLRSDPIPITVKESTRLSVSNVVEGGSAIGSTRLTVADSGLLANYKNLDGLLAPQIMVVGPATWSVVGAAPALYAGCLLIRRRRDRLAGDTGFARRRSAGKRAISSLRGASQSDTPFAHVSSVLTAYVADRCNDPAGGLTRGEVIERLRARDMPDEIVIEVDNLLGECEAAQYGAGGGGDGGDPLQRARRCIELLEKSRF